MSLDPRGDKGCVFVVCELVDNTKRTQKGSVLDLIVMYEGDNTLILLS